MMQHEQGMNVHVVKHEEGYLLDTLGAPFGVILRNGVTRNTDSKTGEEIVTIPDVVGLIGAVVRARVIHPRKFTGAEIKFVRDALSLQAKNLAEFLDITPEHLSRCENGGKVLSAAIEKEFRLAAFLATLMEEHGKLFIRPTKEELEEAKRNLVENDLDEDVKERAVDFVKAFLSLKIEPAYSVDEKPLEFVFSRGKVDKVNDGPRDDDEDKWDTAA